jgi:S-DNA-T family DNA segregation ATPase FtsK/SpoIIIE
MAKGRGKGSPSGAASGGRRFPYGRVALGLLVLAVALGLLFYFYSPAREGASTALEAFLEWFGIGLLIAGLLVLSWAVWRRKGTPSLRKWRIAVGILILILVMFGILSSFKPATGSFSNYGYGGVIGQAMIGWPTTTAGCVAGALRLAAMVILAVFLLAPRQSWDVSKRIFSGLRSFHRRYPLHRYLWMSLCGWGRLFRTLSRAMSNRRRQQRMRPRPAVTPVAHVMNEPPPSVREPVRVEKVKPVPTPVEERVEAAVAVEPAEALAVSAGQWQLPSLGLLERNPEAEPVPVDTERGAKIIEDALASYGVNAKVVQANVGPAVTQYGVEPGWDIKTKEIKKKDKDGNITVQVEEISRTRVKVERIASLANDLALALEAPSIKIEAPVPGKAMVGIEVPNPVAGSVSLRSIIETPPFQKIKAKTKLPLALGKGMSGDGVVADLGKMPHLLIAGATGSGKSVCMKAIIATFLLHATPDDIRFLMIDPKRVELVAFNKIPHLLSPVIINTDKAVATLRWLAKEMDQRYDRLAEVGARDIESYNKNPRVDKPLSYLLLIIDELAELMMTAPDEVERTICRLAQLARATGIHLIIATQRPSVDVVTGLIKANFPARISFSVASQVDSRTILDTVGAEKLLGQGDMLFLPPDAPKPRRLQGSFISEPEIERLVSFWISQRPRDLEIPRLDEETVQAAKPESSEDRMVEKAKGLALEHQHISTSFLQRRLGIGYPRAAKIMDRLEELGVVAPGEPGKSREVLMDDKGTVEEERQ